MGKRKKKKRKLRVKLRKNELQKFKNYSALTTRCIYTQCLNRFWSKIKKKPNKVKRRDIVKYL